MKKIHDQILSSGDSKYKADNRKSLKTGENSPSPTKEEDLIKPKTKSKMALTLADLSLENDYENPKDQNETTPRSNSVKNSPAQLDGIFWKQVLSTPPTGRTEPRRTLTPLPKCSPAFSFPNNNKTVKRRHSLPAKLVVDEKQAVPKIGPQLDYLFKKFLSIHENREKVLEDIREVDEGRGSQRLKNLLQKEKSHQQSYTRQNQQNQHQVSSSTLLQVVVEVPERQQIDDNNSNVAYDDALVGDKQKEAVIDETQVPSLPSDPNLISNSIPIPIRKQAASTHASSATPLKFGGDSRLQSRRDVPKFYFPEGKHTTNTNFIQESLSKAEEKLKQLNNCLNYSKFGELLVACGISLYWKLPFWMALGLAPEATCSSKIFLAFLKYLLSECPDDASRFARIISSASINFPDGYGSKNKTNFNNNNVPMNIKYYISHGNYCLDLKCVEIGMSDFVPMIQDIIDTHPGLGFLRDAPEFHSRYITTVISRIFYKVNRSWSGKLTIAEIRRSNLLRILKRLEEETDINVITEYFSYEHFYVIYCKFWELDKDHDLLIDKHDLAAHADHALSSRIIDRIFSGTVLRGWDVANPSRATHDKMTYSDFVWFLLSEEDKKTPTAVEYWFRCIDLDGDGIISPYELQYFYSEQESRIESLGIEPLHFSNVYCQIVDMLHCSPTGIRLRDLKKNLYLAANVFNTVFNLDKYLEHEQRDPFAAAASLGHPESAEGESDWDKYAAAEYELLIAEENPEHLQDSGLDEEALTPS